MWAAQAGTMGRQDLDASLLQAEPRQDRLEVARGQLVKLQSSNSADAALPFAGGLAASSDSSRVKHRRSGGFMALWRRMPCCSPSVINSPGDGGHFAGGGSFASRGASVRRGATPALAVPTVARRTTTHGAGSAAAGGQADDAKSVGGDTTYHDACSEAGSLCSLSRRTTLDAEAYAGDAYVDVDGRSIGGAGASRRPSDMGDGRSIGGASRRASLSAALSSDDSGPLHLPPDDIPFVKPGSRFVKVPEDVGLGGYWDRVAELSTSLPMPIDTLLKANWVARRAHESINGLLMIDTPTTLSVKVKASVAGLSVVHSEVYNKDGSVTGSMLRRDLKPGRSAFRMWYTSNNEVVFYVETITMTGVVDHVGVEIIQLSDEGLLVCDQGVRHRSTGGTATQRFVGRRANMPGRKYTGGH